MSELDALLEAHGVVGSVKRGAGVEHDHFRSLLAVLGLAPAQGIADQLQRLGRALHGQAVQALAFHAEVFGLDPIFRDLVILQFGNERRRRQAEFVQAIFRMHHQHMLAAKALEHFSQRTA
ncbi:hypothetical protein D3C86_1884760 [compost metagenome]